MEIRRAHILAYSLRSGDATSHHTFALARGLQRHAQTVEIWVSHPPGPLPAEIAPLVRHTHYADYPSGADLTLLNYPLWFPLAEHFAHAPGARIFWYHGVTPPKHWPPSERDFLRNSQFRTELACAAHCIVATSPFTAAELARLSGCSQAQMRVVPLGVDVPAMAHAPGSATIEEVRRRWHLAHKRVLLYLGRVAGNKRIDLALEALARLLPAYPDLHLLVVGDTQDGVITRTLTAALQQQARTLGVDQAVTFTGRVPDVAPYFHLAELYLQPSEHEGFGVPLVEAMATGVPVVASASGAMPWLLAAGETEPAGLLFAPGNSADLAQQVTRVLADAALRRRLVARGHARAGDFSLARFDAAVDDVIAVAHAAAHAPGAAAVPVPPLLRHAEVARRDYRLRPPLRAAALTHFKEAYLDRIVEQQVNFNRLAARRLADVRAEVAALRRAVDTHPATGARPDAGDQTGHEPCV